MRHNLISIIISCLILASCQKEVASDTLTGGSSTTPSACNTYFPLATGNTWTYYTGGTIQVNTVIAPDTVIQGKTFKRVMQTTQGLTNTVFFREDTGNIYGFVDLGAAGVASGNVFINPIRSAAAIGEKWRDTIVVNGLSERFEYEMKEKNISYQVDTLHFTNVDHIQYKVRLDYAPAYNDELVQITDVWFAKCVGGVETKNQSLLFGAVVSTSDQKIKSYSVH